MASEKNGYCNVQNHKPHRRNTFMIPQKIGLGALLKVNSRSILRCIFTFQNKQQTSTFL